MSMRRKRSQGWLAVVALSLAVGGGVTSPVFSQAAPNRSGTIVGKVTDSRGVGQAGVSVNLMNRDGRFAQKVFTQKNGRFRVEGLAPGSYAVEVILPSFLPFWKAYPRARR